MSKGKILLVDDSKLERKMIYDFLIPHNYDVVEVNTGNKALEIIFNNPPDLIILDLILEDLNGIDICKMIKENKITRVIPIIIITSYGDQQLRIKGLEEGADDYLIKPIDRREILARVKSLLKIKEYHQYIDSKSYYQSLEIQVKQKTHELEKTLNQLQDAHANIWQAYNDSLYRLSIAAEYRDDDTAGHIKRISFYSAVIASKLGLDNAFVETLKKASALHDVGKIGIPDNILLKPGKLTKSEWDIMRNHTVIGSKILGGSEHQLLKTAEVIAISHHEKYDGTGYPYQLKENNIPLVGRIVAMADVFDALTSKRVYKPVYSLDKSLRIMRDSIGTHFDPEIAEAFFSCLDDLVDIKNDFEEKKNISKIKII